MIGYNLGDPELEPQKDGLGEILHEPKSVLTQNLANREFCLILVDF
jgi:hypothetical protein